MMRKLLIIILLLVLDTNSGIIYSQKYFTVEDGYAYFINHPKSKGVNFKIRIPEGWEVQEANREPVVGKLVLDNNVFMILVEDLPTFISREESKEVYLSDQYENMILNEYSSRGHNPKILSSSINYLDGYPAELIKASFSMYHPWEDKTRSYIMRSWIIIYEDLVVMLQCMSPTKNEEYINIQSCNMVYSFVFLVDGYVSNYLK